MPEPQNTRRRPRGRLLAGLLLGILTAAPPVRADAPAEDMAVARDFFLIADYSSALDRVTSLLRGAALAPEERVEALALEARCHVALGERMEAIDSFCSAIQLVPAWRPELAAFTEAEREAFAKAFDLCGPLEPRTPRVEVAPPNEPAEVSPVAETAAAWASSIPRDRPWYRSPWVLGGVGGVIAGVTILTLGSDDSAPPVPLPGFPPPPE